MREAHNWVIQCVMNRYQLRKISKQLLMATSLMGMFSIAYIVNLTQNPKVALYLENQKTLDSIQKQSGTRLTFHEYQAVKLIEKQM